MKKQISLLERLRERIKQRNSKDKMLILKYENDIKKLDDCWIGNAAEGFKRVNNDLVTFARNYHNSMKDTEELLTTVANTVSNQ